MRVFPDTNVLLAALATRGLCADLLRALLAQHEVVVGAPVVAELRRNLATKLRMAPARVDVVLAFLEGLERVAAPRQPAVQLPGIDRADGIILACARAAGVEVLVTGDRALLALGSYEKILIASPRELWERLQQRR